MSGKALAVGLTPEQVAARRNSIGGSDAAAVLGVSPYKTPLEVYREKVGEKEPDPPTPAMKRGTVLEPIARALYVEVTGRKVQRQPQQAHPSYPWMHTNVDGRIVGRKKDDRPDLDGPGVLEIKCPGVWAFAKAKREGLPLQWIAQLQHNLEVTGRQWGSFALFSAELWQMLHFDVARDPDLAAGLVVTEQTFWLQHVEKRVPPADVVADPKVAAALAAAQKDLPPGELIQRSDAEWADAAAALLEAKEIGETAEQLEAAAKERLKALMGGPSAVEGAGLRVYWKDLPGKRSFDKAALAKAHPEIDLTAFEKVGKDYQEFRTYQVQPRNGE